jgi:pimeloyl-ACP methyl ester carboxylesterase
MLETKSKDGTRIAFERTGQGPPLVLVHGTTADHTRWAPVLGELEARFTVHAMDRRGRGGSGDSPDYTLEKEFDDVAAMVDSIGEPAHLLGHSYGAKCSLEACLRTNHVRKLVLYEPPIPAGIPIYSAGLVERMQSSLDAGDRDWVVTSFFREVVRMPEAELALLRSLPNWPARVAAAHTIPREMRVDETYQFDAARFASFRVPTLTLLGGDSPGFLKRGTELVANALSTNRTVILPGQQHAAMNTAPEMFAREVIAFLTA